MASPEKSLFVCAKCDAQSPKWNGRCLECGAYGTLEPAGTHAFRPGPAQTSSKTASVVTTFANIAASEEGRTKIGIPEVDRVFGGGVVAGSVTLLGGEPGIGKSTLALMIGSALASPKRRTLYVSGEESAEQVKNRATRLGIATEHLVFLGVTDVDAVIATIEKETPFYTIIDSVQTLWSEDLPSEAGAVGQIRLVAARLTAYAKSAGRSLLIIGHVNKDGQVAGPKTLEHVVDTVLSFEGERHSQLRLLRAAKNRFGSTDECGIFLMEERGLKEVANPSAFLLDERRPGAPGSAVFCALEGTRPMLVEIQALTQKTSFGYPTRRTSGFEQSRLEMLIAVLARHGGVDLSQYDVYVNVIGGLKIKEPAADLAVAAALASAASGVAVAEKTAVWGEIGLGGEVRSAVGGDKRAAECAKLGIASLLAPQKGLAKVPAALRLIPAPSLRQAVAALNNVQREKARP